MPERNNEKMKPERIQERLSDAPGWQIDSAGRALSRKYLFPNLEAVAHFVALVLSLGKEDDALPKITINYLEVTLRIAATKGRALAEDDFDLAKVLNLRA